MKILHVVGARPNFMKIAPLMRRARARPAFASSPRPHRAALRRRDVRRLLRASSALPAPDVDLGVGSGSPRGADREGDDRRSSRSASSERPDSWSVVGDVNSHDGRAAGRGEAADPRRARRGGAAQLRPRRCPRRSTASSPTGSPTCCSRRRRTATRTCSREGVAGGADPSASAT